MDSYSSCSICHTQSKHILATFIYDMTPTDTAELSPQRRQGGGKKQKNKKKNSPKNQGGRWSRDYNLQDEKQTRSFILPIYSSTNHQVHKSMCSWSELRKMYYEGLNSLLCTVDELVFIGPLKACFHSFVVPQLLCVIKELLRGIKKKSFKSNKNTSRKTFIYKYMYSHMKKKVQSLLVHLVFNKSYK